MRHLWRQLGGRCIQCGQKLRSDRTVPDRLSQINNKADRLAKSLGRRPQVQTCSRCEQLVLEGETGFVESYLLIDME